MTVAVESVSMEEVGTELRKWLALRAWGVTIERDLVVSLSEADLNVKAHAQYRHKAPLRTITFRVERLEDIRTKLEEHDCLTRCAQVFGRAGRKCDGLARVTDEEFGGFDQSYVCDGCGRRWGA